MPTVLCGQPVSAEKSARKFVSADLLMSSRVRNWSPVDPTKRTMQTGGNEQKGWTQTQTAARTGLDQPKVSHFMRGRLSGFSADRSFFCASCGSCWVSGPWKNENHQALEI